MRALFLSNVGNRDVRIDGEPIPAEKSRAVGEQILTEYERYEDRLSAPMLEAALSYVLGRGTEGDIAPVRVFLFATNQDESAGLHRQRDTVSLAKVLQRYLPQRFPVSKPSRTRRSLIDDVRVVEIQSNPSYYDEMYEFFGGQLRTKRLSPGEIDACFVSPVGGVPAANFALLLRAVERYAEKCHPIYVPEGSRHAVPIDIADQLTRGLLRSLAAQEARNFEFGRAAELLDASGAERALIGLARYAQRRLHFDFTRATRVLEEEVEKAARGPDRELALGLRRGLDDLLAGKREALVRELYHNARVTCRGGRYVDFLLRVFRLQEAALRLVVERELGLPTDAANGRAHPDFVKGIEGNPALLAHMRKPFGGHELDYQRPPTLAVLRHLLSYSVAAAGDVAREGYRSLPALVTRLEGLADLRNKSIGAHGFQGVSEEDIRDRYGEGHDVLSDLADLVRALGIDPGDDPFECVRDLILARLAQER